MRQIAVALLFGTFFVLLGPDAALAHCESTVSAGVNSWQAQGHCHNEEHSSESAYTSAADSSTTYSLQEACVRGDGISGPDFFGCGGQFECGDDGLLYFVWAAYTSGESEIVGEQCIGSGEVPPVAVTPGLVLRAFERIPLPASEVVIQPPGGETLVNLDTVFSTRARDFTRTVRLLRHRVELAITASEFRWVSGDGSTMRTDWAGRPWREGTPMRALITHRYDDAQVGLRPRVDTTWSARYRVAGGPWREVPGTVTIQGTPYDLTVRSASPHLAG